MSACGCRLCAWCESHCFYWGLVQTGACEHVLVCLCQMVRAECLLAGLATHHVPKWIGVGGNRITCLGPLPEHNLKQGLGVDGGGGGTLPGGINTEWPNVRAWQN